MFPGSDADLDRAALCAVLSLAKLPRHLKAASGEHGDNNDEASTRHCGD